VLFFVDAAFPFGAEAFFLFEAALLATTEPVAVLPSPMASSSSSSFSPSSICTLKESNISDRSSSDRRGFFFFGGAVFLFEAGAAPATGR
jgi:hypothetical protein